VEKKAPLAPGLCLGGGGWGQGEKRGKNRKFKNTWLGMRRERGKKRIREKNRKLKKHVGLLTLFD
jgi:hypothetical protein